MSLLDTDTWVRRGTILTWGDQEWEIDPAGWAYMAESSLVYNGADWQLWWSGGGELTHGVGYATGPTALGPWTKYVGAVDTPLTFPGAGFELDTQGGGRPEGLADDVYYAGNVATVPTFAMPSDARPGSTGTKSQHLHWEAGGTDAGKYFWLSMSTAPGIFLDNETALVTQWIKGSVSGNVTVTMDVMNYGGGPSYALNPTGAWTETDPFPPLYGTDYVAGWLKNVSVRMVHVASTGTNGVVDLYIDDLTGVHGVANPVKPRRGEAGVILDSDGTYHMFMGGMPSNNINHSTSEDGIHWSADDIAVVKGAGGSWEGSLHNAFPFKDRNGTWYLFYEAIGIVDAEVYEGTGVATASSLHGPWTKYRGNPLIDFCHPDVHRVGDQYLMYGHVVRSAAVPDGGSVVVRAKADHPLGPWVFDQDPVFMPLGIDEGEDLADGQTCDVRIYNDGTQYIMYYTATSDFHASDVPLEDGPTIGEHIKALTSQIGWSSQSTVLPEPRWATPVMLSLALFAGDTSALEMTLPCDLTDCQTWWFLADRPGGTIIRSKQATIINESSGTIVISREAVDTESLGAKTPPPYYYEVKVTDRFGRITTIASGRVLIRPVLTAPES